ncbi:hypothetical protein CCR75_000898 [Bremia lactucae]|uniref:Transmembrane protein n=1 Tax=Bremia lactucae TaxID=4779 RepID=A0A976FP69_BRELC|nr:hypothetical protein CCR75_000898 [Bremia lactucae]
MSQERKRKALEARVFPSISLATVFLRVYLPIARRHLYLFCRWLGINAILEGPCTALTTSSFASSLQDCPLPQLLELLSLMPSLKLLVVALAAVQLTVVNATYLAGNRKSSVDAFYSNPNGRRLVEVKPVSWFGTYASNSGNRRLDQTEEERLFGLGSSKALTHLVKHEKDLNEIERAVEEHFGAHTLAVLQKDARASKALKSEFKALLTRSKEQSLSKEEIKHFTEKIIQEVHKSRKMSKKKKFVLGAGFVAAFIFLGYLYKKSQTPPVEGPKL